MGRILIEVEPRRTERKIEIGNDDVLVHTSRYAPADIVCKRAGPGPSLCADKGNRAADGWRVGIDIETGHRLDDSHGMQWCDEIFVDTLTDHLAIKRNIIHVADNDHLGASITDFRKLAQLRKQLRSAGASLHHDEIRSRRLPILLDSCGDTAHVNGQMRLGKAAVLSGALNRAARRRLLAKRMNGDTRHRLHHRRPIVVAGNRCNRSRRTGSSRCVRHRRRFVDDFFLRGVCHWSTLLTAPES